MLPRLVRPHGQDGTSYVLVEDVIRAELRHLFPGQQVLEVRVARQREFTAQVPSLTTQRRAVLGHPERLERLSLRQGDRHLEIMPPAKNRLNNPEIIYLSNSYEKIPGPQIRGMDETSPLENAALPGRREMALTS